MLRCVGSMPLITLLVLKLFSLLNLLIFRAGVDDKKCVEAISTYKLPQCDLLDQCEQLNENFINSYRRLIPAHYADGLSKV